MQTGVYKFHIKWPSRPVFVAYNTSILLFVLFFFPTVGKATSLPGLQENSFTKSTERFEMVDSWSPTIAMRKPEALRGVLEGIGASYVKAEEQAGPPRVIKLFPEKGDQFVEQDVKPEVHFDGEVVLGDGLIELYHAETGEQIMILDPAAGTGISQPEAHVIRLNFGVLELNAPYYILFSEGSFKSSEGNPTDGFLSNTDWSFRTVTTGEPMLVIESEENPLDFGVVTSGSESEPKVYRLGGRNISEQVALQVPGEFIFSLNGGGSYIRGDTVHLTSTQLENYKEIWVKFAPREANGETYQQEVKHFSRELDTVRLGLLGKAEPLPEPVSIAQARALETGSMVRVSGVVTDGSSFSENLRYIEDTTAGLAIFAEGQTTLSTLNRGDSILVAGALELSEAGLLQIGGGGLTIELLKKGAEIPVPAITYVENWSSSLESRLLEVRNIRFSNAGEAFAENQTYLFTDTREVQGTIKIAGPSNPLIGTLIPEVASVRGILSREETYLLLPRDAADVEEKQPTIQYTLPDGKLRFGFVAAGATSDPLRLHISGLDLAEPIELKVGMPFELSSGDGAYSQEVRLPADASEVEVFVRFSPQVADAAIYNQLLTLQSSSAGTVNVDVIGMEGVKPEYLSLQQARGMPLGEKVKIKGVITSGESISVHERFMQDTTGGIVLVQKDENAFDSLEIGTELQLTGILEEQNERLQLQGDLQWEVLNKNAGEPTALEADADDLAEENESRLLQFTDLAFFVNGTFEGKKSYQAGLPSGGKVWIMIATENHPLVGRRIPLQARVKGILTHSPDGYEVLPRIQEDLTATDAVLATDLPEGALDFFFVPAGSVSEAKIMELSGTRVQGSVYLETQAPFEISINGKNFGYTATLELAESTPETVYVRYAPSTPDNSLIKGQLSLATTNGRTIAVPLTGIEGERPEVLPIAQARALGAGQAVRVQGILTTGKDFYAGKRFIQDTTGGLLLLAEADSLEEFKAGDMLELSGVLAESANMLELADEVSIMLLEAGAGVPAAQEITAADQLSEENEGRFLRLPSVQFTQTGRFEQGRRYPIVFESGEEAFVRISGDNHALAGEFIPQEAGISGVLLQEENEYLLLPRNAADVEVVSYPTAIVLDAPENGLDFGYVRAGKLSFMAVFWISGLGLEDSISVSVEEPFLLATDTASWSRELKLAPQVNQAHLYVRFSPIEENGAHYSSEVHLMANGVQEYVPVEGWEGAASGMVYGPDFQEDFESCPALGEFTIFDGDGLAQWQCQAGRGVKQGSAIGIRVEGGEAEANSDWLISPRLSITRGSLLSFDVARPIDGPLLELLVSVDYSGSGNPQHASWEPLTIPWSEDEVRQRITSEESYHTISEISLAAFAGQDVYLAFRYTASYETAGGWLIDNFKVAESPLAGFAEAEGKIQEGGSTTYRLLLSKPAEQQSTLRLQFMASEELLYGENKDFVTNPPLDNGQMVLELVKGAQEVRFTVSALEDLLQEEEEVLTVTLLEVGEGLLSDEDRMQLSVTFRSNNARDMTIPAIREVSEKGLLVHQNTLVRVKGIAYGPNLSLKPGGLEFRLLEPGGTEMKAVAVALDEAAGIEYAPEDGDELQVTGVVKNEEGLAVLHPQKIELLQQEVPLEEAQLVEQLNEENESALLVVENLEVISGWQNEPAKAFMVKVRNAAGTEFQVQIRPASNLFGTERQSTRLNITGFGVQQDVAAPYDGGYYLLPRSQADLQWITETGFSNKPEVNEFLLYPNPATKILLIQSEKEYLFERIQVYSLGGRLLQEQTSHAGGPVDVSELEPGTYLLKIKLRGGGYSVGRFTIRR